MKQELIHWLSMGGYSTYIWTAYGLVFMVFAANYYSAKRQQVRVQKTLQRWFSSSVFSSLKTPPEGV
jgi:heme exporter protein D